MKGANVGKAFEIVLLVIAVIAVILGFVWGYYKVTGTKVKLDKFCLPGVTPCDGTGSCKKFKCTTAEKPPT